MSAVDTPIRENSLTIPVGCGAVVEASFQLLIKAARTITASRTIPSCSPSAVT